MSLNQLVDPLVPQDIIVNDLDVKGNLTVEGDIIDSGNFTVENSNPIISILNNGNNTNRATLLLNGKTATLQPTKIQSDSTGNTVIENFQNNANINLLLTGTGTVNVPNITINSTSKLTNYTQGNIVPVLKFGGATTGITYSLQTGQYTNIGNRCDFVINISLTNKGSATGDVTIDGLPFIPVTGIVNTALVYSLNVVSATASQYFANSSSLFTTNLALYEVQNSTGNVIALNDTNFSNTSGLIIQGTYFTNTA